MFIIVMGVSGSGKSTIGKMVAERIGCAFYDGDDYHPPENVTKMAAGIPLTDADRVGWLDALARLMQAEMDAGRDGVIACSALKSSYRDALRRGHRQEVKFAYLHGDFAVILERMRRRQHFMKPEMLQSQFDTLEAPHDILTIDVRLPPEQIAQTVIDQLVQPVASMGIIGLGLVGRLLAQNLARNGRLPAGYNPDGEPPEWLDIPTARSVEELAVMRPPPPHRLPRRDVTRRDATTRTRAEQSTARTTRGRPRVSSARRSRPVPRLGAACWSARSE